MRKEIKRALKSESKRTLLPTTEIPHVARRTLPAEIAPVICEPPTVATRVLPTLLKLPDAAYELQVSVGYIYELVHLGILDLAKIGPKVSRITGASVVRAAAQRAKPSSGILNLQQNRRKEAAE